MMSLEGEADVLDPEDVILGDNDHLKCVLNALKSVFCRFCVT